MGMSSANWMLQKLLNNKMTHQTFLKSVKRSKTMFSPCGNTMVMRVTWC
jgi:hypothetical protein